MTNKASRDQTTGKITYPTVNELIRSLTKQGVLSYSRPHEAGEINRIEENFELHLPLDYRQFLQAYGCLVSTDVTIFGLEDDKLGVPTIGSLLILFRVSYPEMPLELLPIEDLGQGSYACIKCGTSENAKYSPIVSINLAVVGDISKSEELAPSFIEYLFGRLSNIRRENGQLVHAETEWKRAWKVFEQDVTTYQDQFKYDHDKGGKLPRNTDWRPYRYCIQDVVFGVCVVRHLQEGNCLQVDVYLTADIPEYGPLAGAHALTAFLLSEAYKCGGSMEIRFTKNVENETIPLDLVKLAASHGIRLNKNHNRIEPQEAKKLYAAITGFSVRLQESIRQLESLRKMKMARACYVVHHGIWTKEQLEMITLGSENPESILSGEARPENQHLYYHDLLHARAALLAGIFERKLGQIEREKEDGILYDMEDDLRSVETTFDGDTYTKLYRCSDPVELDWLLDTGPKRTIPENISFQVLIRARDAADFQLHISADLEAAIGLQKKNANPTFILTPSDFMDLPRAEIGRIHSKAQKSKIGILLCPESVINLDADAAQRLANSRVIRQ